MTLTLISQTQIWDTDLFLQGMVATPEHRESHKEKYHEKKKVTGRKSQGKKKATEISHGKKVIDKKITVKIATKVPVYKAVVRLVSSVFGESFETLYF